MVAGSIPAAPTNILKGLRNPDPRPNPSEFAEEFVRNRAFASRENVRYSSKAQRQEAGQQEQTETRQVDPPRLRSGPGAASFARAVHGPRSPSDGGAEEEGRGDPGEVGLPEGNCGGEKVGEVIIAAYDSAASLQRAVKCCQTPCCSGLACARR